MELQKAEVNKGTFLLTAFIALVLAGVVLKLTASICMLFTISIFLACVMYPMVTLLERCRISRIFSILLAVFVIILGLTLVGFVLYSSGRTILTHYVKYEARLVEIYRWAGQFIELPYDEALTFFENLWAQLEFRNNVKQLTLSFSNGFITFLKNALMVVFFVIFLLIEASSFKKKLMLAFENKFSRQIRKIILSVARDVTRYLSVKFIISLITGLLVGIALQCAGLEFAPVWGVLQFLLNFIPILGSVALGAAVMLFALLQFWPEPGHILAIGLIMLIINQVIGNVIEPRVMGHNLGISALVILLSLLLWGWLWGFVGMVLAVPMTVIIKIICENIPLLEPISIMLSSGKAAAIKRNAPSQETKE